MARGFRSWNPDCKVYVGNLQDNCLKTDVENAFAKFGPLKNVWVARNPPGFAFVEFEDSRDAEDSVRALDGTRIGGNRVRVEMSHGRSRRGGGGRRFGGGAGGPGYDRSGGADRYGGPRRDYRRRSISRSRSRSPPRRRYSSRTPSRSRSRSTSRNRPRTPPSRSPSRERR
ncbi:serine/arginine-rich splicing factor 3 [Dermatophagoides farinae]|uniref:Rna-binding protein-like protein 3 n=1 Tax=Dermatophagoides farinae TaxID=6954 RepID=A0A9D4SG84_DERFA|nr:RNA-binding protein 1-like isoform X1 [Dermatophagoides farinae]KAH7641124.1 rna-binding protein-like protein 3 [Dermatophagoides farinae]